MVISYMLSHKTHVNTFNTTFIFKLVLKKEHQYQEELL